MQQALTLYAARCRWLYARVYNNEKIAVAAHHVIKIGERSWVSSYPHMQLLSIAEPDLSFWAWAIFSWIFCIWMFLWFKTISELVLEKCLFTFGKIILLVFHIFIKQSDFDNAWDLKKKDNYSWLLYKMCQIWMHFSNLKIQLQAENCLMKLVFIKQLNVMMFITRYNPEQHPHTKNFDWNPIEIQKLPYFHDQKLKFESPLLCAS